MAELVKDSLRCGQELVGFESAEIGEVGCVATIDDPWVQDVEIVVVDVWRAGWWVARGDGSARGSWEQRHWQRRSPP